MLEWYKEMASKQEQSKPVAQANGSDGAGQAFFVAAANMSWQLAIVVLVPIVGGFELDKALGSLPALTILGFILAMAGLALVIWRQLKIFMPPAPKSKGRAK